MSQSLKVNPSLALQLSVRTSAALTLEVFGVCLVRRENGLLEESVFSRSMVIAAGSADRSMQRQLFTPFADGELSFVTVTTTSTVQRGQTYVRLEVVYNGNQATPAYILRKGYLTTNGPLNWPQGSDEAANSGFGYQGSTTAAVQSAPTATSIANTFTVPTNAVWRIKGFLATMTTITTGGQRFGFLLAVSAGLCFNPDPVTDALAQARWYGSISGSPPQSSDDLITANQSRTMPIPQDMIVVAAGTVVFRVEGVDGTETFSATSVSLRYEEFIAD